MAQIARGKQNQFPGKWIEVAGFKVKKKKISPRKGILPIFESRE